MNKNVDYYMALLYPRSLHRKLVESADAEGMSLNALCIAYLAAAVGIKERAGRIG